jgi:hypothetical protein
MFVAEKCFGTFEHRGCVQFFSNYVNYVIYCTVLFLIMFNNVYYLYTERLESYQF